jgi:hypothetical protein
MQTGAAPMRPGGPHVHALGGSASGLRPSRRPERAQQRGRGLVLPSGTQRVTALGAVAGRSRQRTSLPL